VLQLLPGVGPTTAGRLLDAVADQPSIGALAELPAPQRGSEAWPDFIAFVRALATREAGWPGELAAVRAWYQPHLERLYDDAALRAADLAQLEQIAAGYPSRQRFLTELTLDPPDATSDRAGPPLRDEDYLILSTIHSAKGQEWRSVFVLNTVDGCIPSDLATDTPEEIEEERRLLYVAMTRAKDRLDLIVPQRFYVHQQARTGDRHLYASRTRFIPSALLVLFEQRAWPGAARDAGPAGARAGVQMDIGARMRRMWK
jgi:DNA helicase-2/ATP-dependent DNA helicase PcrA